MQPQVHFKSPGRGTSTRQIQGKHDEEVRVQLADRSAATIEKWLDVRPVVRRQGNDGIRTELLVQSRRIWVFYLLEKRWQGITKQTLKSIYNH